MSLKSLSAALALTVAVNAPVNAGEFNILIYETNSEFALRTEASEKGQAYWAAYGAYANALQQAGVIRGGAPLQLPETARVVTADGVKAGNGVASKLHLGGYFKIEAKSMDEAVAWAAKAPAASRGGAVEVRESFPAPGM